jgi:hypothetical protein
MMTAMWVAMALCKPWQGIEPGESTRDDIVEKFGEPTKTVAGGGSIDIMAYQKEKSPPGTKQVQFKVELKSGVVQRIDVFPLPEIRLKEIDKAYGPKCEPGKKETKDAPCYVKHATPERLYLVYEKLGLAVFFGDDGYVASFAFLPAKDGKDKEKEKP